MSGSRLEGVRALLSERNFDALVVSRPENLAYLSGFTGSSGWLLITHAQAYLITDFRYVEQATAQAPAFQVVKPSSTHYGLLAELLEKEPVRTVGFEGDFLTYDEYGVYRQFLAERELMPATGLVEAMRMVKDETEQEIMRRSAAIADEG